MAVLCVFLTLCAGGLSTLFPYQLGLVLDAVTKQDNDRISPSDFRRILLRNLMLIGLTTLGIGFFAYTRYICLQNFQ